MKRKIGHKIKNINFNFMHIRNDSLFILTYVLGLFFGSFFAIYFKDTASFFTDNEFIKNIMTNGIGEYSFVNAFLNSLKYPMIIFFLGFTAFGFFFVPAVVFAKGFFVSASVSSVINTLGTKGIWVAVSIFGIQTIITIPCIVLMASLSFYMSKNVVNSLVGIKSVTYGGYAGIIKYAVFFFVIAFLLFAFSVVDVAITPRLVSILTKQFV